MFRKILWTSIVVLMLGLLFYIFSKGLQRDQRQMPSALLNKPVPDFKLDNLYDDESYTNKDIIGEVALVNIWASWCAPCAEEHHMITELANQGVIIFGLNYQDDREAAIEWLKDRGDPFQKILFDPDGDTSIDWGVIAVPETFLIDKNGIIRYRHIGGLTAEIWNENFLPLYLHYKEIN